LVKIGLLYYIAAIGTFGLRFNFSIENFFVLQVISTKHSDQLLSKSYSCHWYNQAQINL